MHEFEGVCWDGDILQSEKLTEFLHKESSFINCSGVHNVKRFCPQSLTFADESWSLDVSYIDAEWKPFCLSSVRNLTHSRMKVGPLMYLTDAEWKPFPMPHPRVV